VQKRKNPKKFPNFVDSKQTLTIQICGNKNVNMGKENLPNDGPLGSLELILWVTLLLPPSPLPSSKRQIEVSVWNYAAPEAKDAVRNFTCLNWIVLDC
jgi:hypothetical protein